MRDDGELAIVFINLRVYSDPYPQELFHFTIQIEKFHYNLYSRR